MYVLQICYMNENITYSDFCLTLNFVSLNTTKTVAKLVHLSTGLVTLINRPLKMLIKTLKL